MPMLNQIIDGLRCFGTCDLIKEFPNLLEPVFVQCGCFLLKPEEFLEDIVGEFSDTGLNKRQQEINIFKYFNDFVEDEIGDENTGIFSLYLFALFTLDVCCKSLFNLITKCKRPMLTNSIYHLFIQVVMEFH